MPDVPVKILLRIVQRHLAPGEIRFALRKDVSSQGEVRDGILSSFGSTVHTQMSAIAFDVMEKIAQDTVSRRDRTDPDPAPPAFREDVISNHHVTDPQLGKDPEASAIGESVFDDSNVLAHTAVGIVVEPDADIRAILYHIAGDQNVMKIARAHALTVSVRPTAAPGMPADVSYRAIQHFQAVLVRIGSYGLDPRLQAVLDQAAGNLGRAPHQLHSKASLVDVNLRDALARDGRAELSPAAEIFHD